MGDILGYPLYESPLVSITIGKVLVLLLIILITRVLLRFYKSFVHRQVRSMDVFDKEKEHILVRVGRTVIWVVALAVAVTSLGLGKLVQLMLNYNIAKFESVTITPWKILVLILIIVFTRVISRLVRIILRKNFSKKAWIDEGKEYTIYKLTKYSLYGLAFLIGLTSVGIDIKLILAGAGALLVGLGFGLQHLFYDLISGLIILFEGPVKVGDVIEVQGIVARVQQIDIRTSKVMTRDGKYIIIPNSKLVGEHVVNWTHSSELTRFAIKVHVKFGSDTSLVKDVLYNCALRHPDVSKNREIIVRFEEFGEHAFYFNVFFWARKTWVVETLQSEIRLDIDRQFRKHGIQIPYPQRDLHIVQSSEGAPPPFGEAKT
jgi:small-conductance mechanosensitive channel